MSYQRINGNMIASAKTASSPSSMILPEPNSAPSTFAALGSAIGVTSRFVVVGGGRVLGNVVVVIGVVVVVVVVVVVGAVVDVELGKVLVLVAFESVLVKNVLFDTMAVVLAGSVRFAKAPELSTVVPFKTTVQKLRRRIELGRLEVFFRNKKLTQIDHKLVHHHMESLQLDKSVCE